MATPIVPANFTLKDDGSIQESPANDQCIEPIKTPIPKLTYRDEDHKLWLYHGNCFEMLDAIALKYSNGRFDAIFADPPYFLSNGGITCHAGKMVKVDKGDWDKSQGPVLNHEFNLEWLRRCQRVLKPNGTIWVSGTHHVIFSIGFAMQQLGFKILNDIAWEKPNPPPNLSCRYFTHSTETILWAAKNEKSKHVFNYQEMRKVTGKQMKTVWRQNSFQSSVSSVQSDESNTENLKLGTASPGNVWTMSAPGGDEKQHGKHPTQKPVALIERCLLASTNEGDLVLDPFLGGGTTAVAAVRLRRACIAIEMDMNHVALAAKRCDREIVSIWLRHFQVRMEITVVDASDGIWRAGIQNDLDLFSETINGSGVDEKDKSLAPTESIYHECKFVFLSAAQVERGAVVHTTVDVSLQEAWAKTPTGKKRETTHIVRCETEIFRVKP